MLQTYGEITKDFFEQNPEWKYIPSSEKLLSENSKKVASTVRWCVWLIFDPESPYFAGNTLESRLSLTKKYINEYEVIPEDSFEFNKDTGGVVSEDFQYVIDWYPKETMSRKKRDYYEREHSYNLLKKEERNMKDIKDRAMVQQRLSKVFSELDELYEEILEESNKEKEHTRSRGDQQSGSLFRK